MQIAREEFYYRCDKRSGLWLGAKFELRKISESRIISSFRVVQWLWFSFIFLNVTLVNIVS